jgi:predicted dehydrogenase
MGAATKVIYPSAGYHTEDAAANAKIERPNIKVVALADLFEDRLEACKGQLAKVGCNIPKERCFVGFDAYKQLLASADVNYAILATPPHFRPMHLKAAIEAGKHVFMEKPVAVDVPGVKMVMEAGALATQKGLGIAAGTQRRHQKSYIETIKRLRDGAIGEIVYARCYWNGGRGQTVPLPFGERLQKLDGFSPIFLGEKPLEQLHFLLGVDADRKIDVRLIRRLPGGEPGREDADQQRRRRDRAPIPR